jgi:hypothetical protein
LAVDALEDRTVLSAARVFGGLEFLTSGEFVASQTATGTQVRADGPVQVGVAPRDEAAFVPLVRFADGVSFTDGDPAARFTGRGAMSAIVSGQSIDLVGAADRDFSASDLLSGAVNLAGGKSLSVAGAEFTLSGLELTDGAV